MAKKKSRARRIKGAKPRDPFLLFVNAKGFDYITRIVDKHPEHESILMWPKLANEAFSLELYLKCLHRIRRRKPWGHDVWDLFRTLGRRDQRKISKYLLETARQHPDYMTMFSHGVSFDAVSVAKRASSMFLRARYWSDSNLPEPDDHGYVTNAGIGSLSDAIVRLILELRPDWPEKLQAVRFVLPGSGRLPT